MCCQDVLALEMDVLMSEEAAWLPGLRPALGRLANAMVAVLGPELSLGSAAYQKTRALLQDMQVRHPWHTKFPNWKGFHPP